MCVSKNGFLEKLPSKGKSELMRTTTWCQRHSRTSVFLGLLRGDRLLYRVPATRFGFFLVFELL